MHLAIGSQISTPARTGIVSTDTVVLRIAPFLYFQDHLCCSAFAAWISRVFATSMMSPFVPKKEDALN